MNFNEISIIYNIVLSTWFLDSFEEIYFNVYSENIPNEMVIFLPLLLESEENN